MSTRPPRRPSYIALQVLVLVLFVIAALALLYRLGAFEARPGFPHTVTYRVSGSAGTAFVTYTQPNGVQTQRLDVALPWQTTVTISKRTTVILTAGNPGQAGTIACAILLDGEEWKRDSASAPQDKVSCGGVVR